MKSKLFWFLRRFGAAFLVTVLVLTAFPAGRAELQQFPDRLGRLSVQTAEKAAFTLGLAGVAYAVAPDYTVDGTDDNAQAQAALNALPATGGKLIFFSGNYGFSATVSRAINNVIIEGDGKATYFANDGGTALFSAGAQTGWVFKDFRTDAGYLTLATDTIVDRVQNNTGMLVGPSGATTIIVAASNASDNEIASAHFVTDGVADEVQINAAIDALTAGGTVTLTSGQFNLAAAIDLSDGVNNIWLRGQGKATALVTTTDIDTIDATPAAQTANIRVTDMNITTSGAIKASKAAIRTNALWNFAFTDLTILNQYDAIVTDNSTVGTIGDLYIQDFTRSALYTNDVSVLDVRNVNANNVIESTYGWLITGDTNGIQAFNADFMNSGTGIAVLPGNGKTVEWLFFEAVMADQGNNSGWVIGDSSTGYIHGITLVSCWAGGNAAAGMLITAPADGVRIIGAKIVINGQYGILLNTGSADVTIQDSDIISNGTLGANPGIYVAAGVGGFSVVDNRMSNGWNMATNLQNYGIWVGVGGSDNYSITGNQVIGNTVAGILDQGTGTNKRIANNIGYKTEASGTGTITTTSVAVTHGLSITPTLAKIKIVGLEDPTTAVGTIWVSGATSTQFTVNVETDPGATDWDFGWSYAD